LDFNAGRSGKKARATGNDMLCEICNKRKAQVHVGHERETSADLLDLCTDCFKKLLPELTVNFWSGHTSPPREKAGLVPEEVSTKEVVSRLKG
jgi:hypothetical protein